MAYISFQPSDFFNATTYVGTGASHAITGVGFQPDAVWIKETGGTENHSIQNSVVGSTSYVNTDRTNAEATNAESVKSFDADGFTLGTRAAVNNSSDEYISWNWKAGSTASGATTGSGTAKTYSAGYNTTSGFSIVKYTGNGTTGHTIPHHLGAVPETIFVKSTAINNWNCYAEPLTAAYILRLNTTASSANENNRFQATPTSTVFSLGDDAHTNGNDVDYIAYLWTPIKGYSSFGEFTGNGDDDGPFVYTGFRPAYVMLRNSSATQSWQIYTNGTNSVAQKGMQSWNEMTTLGRLKADADEAASTKNAMDFLSNGFKIRTTASDINSGTNILWFAFAEFPTVSSNDIPVVAR